MKLRVLISAGLLCGALSACPFDAIGPEMALPGIAIKDTQARNIEKTVGEPVTVILTITFSNPEGSSVPTYEVTGLELGTCFRYQPPTSTEESVPGGLCGGQEYPLPPSITLLAGTDAKKLFEDFTLRPGQRRSIRYPFTFTSATPGQLQLRSHYRFYTPDGNFQYGEESQPSVRVTFEL